MKKPSIVIEIQGGSLVGAYTDSDIELILVDYDEISGGASAVIIPDPAEDLSPETKRLAADAIERAHV